MHILAHRGYWKNEEDKNSLNALLSGLKNGFGIETDIRDLNGKLVISHNIATADSPSLEQFFREYRNGGYDLPLALNVKADGIQYLLKAIVRKYTIENYFLFDMSVPEMVVNRKEDLIFYTRHSDIEPVCILYDHAQGVWLDSFYEEKWLTESMVSMHLNDGKRVGIISPEVHGFHQSCTWEMLKRSGFSKSSDVMLCTDRPKEAKEFFGL